MYGGGNKIKLIWKENKENFLKEKRKKGKNLIRIVNSVLIGVFEEEGNRGRGRELLEKE